MLQIKTSFLHQLQFFETERQNPFVTALKNDPPCMNIFEWGGPTMRFKTATYGSYNSDALSDLPVLRFGFGSDWEKRSTIGEFKRKKKSMTVDRKQHENRGSHALLTHQPLLSRRFVALVIRLCFWEAAVTLIDHKRSLVRNYQVSRVLISYVHIFNVVKSTGTLLIILWKH